MEFSADLKENSLNSEVEAGNRLLGWGGKAIETVSRNYPRES